MDTEERDNKIEKLLTGQTRILAILENDPKIGKKGLVHKVDDLEKKITLLIITRKVKNTLWGATGGLIVGVILWILKEFKT